MTEIRDLTKVIEESLANSAADEIEILAFQTSNGLTRVANSEIHQNVAETNSAISIRAIVDNRIGVASTNRPEISAIDHAIDAAIAHAKVAPRIDDWPGLPNSVPHTHEVIVSATDDFSPGKRAELIREALTVAKNEKLTMAGSLETGRTNLYIGNIHTGVSKSFTSEASFSLVLMSLDSSGFSTWLGHNIEDLDISGLARAAARKALASRKPRDLEPGAYTVILEPAAVADLLGFLAYVGLGAQAVQEKRSFMVNNFNQQLLDPKITFLDDANDPRTIGPPFDFEGVPKEKVVFFDKGIARGVVYDSRTAARVGKKSTGHALPAPNPHGPFASNLILEPGETSLDNMIAETETGVLVTRFHYTNVEEPMKAVLTGMTRDGTFLIENGKLVGGLKNLRFTQSILDALSAVITVGSDSKLLPSLVGTCSCPSLKIENFNFTGISDK